ncbi:hypothetical protein [Burkholderia multivorans]|uniref:hypothetical protein n=1 Tax=Burkholderia multivorans TaxID=87883 RepID=UPI00158D0E88|nr:hypothetical protein [Burkholderia multivorans]
MRKNTVKFETQEARELHARVQTLGVIQTARGDKAKWLADDRRRFWRNEAPFIGGMGLVGLIASIGLGRLFGSDPLVGISFDLVFVTIVAVTRYPRA